MNKLTVVSVTDGKVGNINAAMVFFQNLSELSSSFDHLFLLTMDGQIPEGYADYFSHLGVEVVAYRMPETVMSGDPYRVKYLLSYFACDMASDRRDILYLDPDHIVQHDLHLNDIVLKESEIVVSSEVRALPELENTLTRGRHCNTSLLFTNVQTLKAVCHGWIQEYETIRETVDVRNREEIAMMIAAKKSGAKARPCDSLLQCGIDTYRKESLLFHYGGQSRLTADLKRILSGDDYGEIIKRLDRYRTSDNVMCASALAKSLQNSLTVIRRDFA